MATIAELNEIRVRSNLDSAPDLYRKLRLNKARRAVKDRVMLLKHIDYLNCMNDILRSKLME